MNGDYIPTPADFAANRVTNPNQSQVLRQRLYDYQVYPTAGQSQMTFFAQPIGSGVTSAQGATVGTSKTEADTNMRIGGQLPNGMGYMIQSIEVFFIPGNTATANTFVPQRLAQSSAGADAATVLAAVQQFNDVNVIRNSGTLKLRVLEKVFLTETPLLAFPPKTFFDVDGAIASNAAGTAVTVTGSAKAAGRPYYLDTPISLQAAMNFEVIITWPGAVATPSGFNGRIGVIFDGFQYLASQ